MLLKKHNPSFGQVRNRPYSYALTTPKAEGSLPVSLPRLPNLGEGVSLKRGECLHPIWLRRWLPAHWPKLTTELCSANCISGPHFSAFSWPGPTRERISVHGNLLTA